MSQPLTENKKPAVYLFLDEGGNFDFTEKGSRYFCMTCVSMVRPFQVNTALDSYKYDCLEYDGNNPIEHNGFHGSHDNRHIRDNVFKIIGQYLQNIVINQIEIEKAIVPEPFRTKELFYTGTIMRLLESSLLQTSDFSKIIIVTDRIPIQRKRQVIEKSIKSSVAKLIPANIPYTVLHHPSYSHYGLQVADYCNWALFRKLEGKGTKYYDLIAPAISCRVIRNDPPNYP